MIEDLQEVGNQVNSPHLARNMVSSKKHHCAASQTWLGAVPESFRVYLPHLWWRKCLCTQFAAWAKQFSL